MGGNTIDPAEAFRDVALVNLNALGGRLHWSAPNSEKVWAASIARWPYDAQKWEVCRVRLGAGSHRLNQGCGSASAHIQRERKKCLTERGPTTRRLCRCQRGLAIMHTTGSVSGPAKKTHSIAVIPSGANAKQSAKRSQNREVG